MYLADRYEIVGKIGTGGMSDVYKAKDHVLSRFVAIKVLKQEFSDDRNFVTKFRTEAQSAAGLEHPNIVNIYDVGSEEGLHYIVMEHVEGITLKTYIEKKGQLTFKEAISIAIQVARGIEAAHNKHLIHRDIKPQNIIISTEGKVKVTDFGIARAASANTISSDVMGSVHYASPEQARNGFVDGRSDIYSLGIVMYEMVTGRVPFDGDTTVAVAIQHLQEEMENPTAYAQDLPVSMEKIILKCTQKNPDRRYQTIVELLNDLRKALISPDEDFVVIAPLVNNGKTKVISQEELNQIKEQRAVVPPASDMNMDDEEIEDSEEDLEEDIEDDEEEESFNPKLDKAMTIMSIVALIIIVIFSVYLVGSIMGLFSSGKKPDSTERQTVTESVLETESDSETETDSDTEDAEPVEMIKITGMSVEEAEEALEELGIQMEIVEERESDEEPGTILEQSIKKGTMVEPESTVEVVVAKDAEAETVTMPKLVDETEASAISKLDSLNLKYKKEYQYNSEIAAGKVISQSIAGGTSVEVETTVTLVISQGAESIKVPGVAGESKDNAVKKLENAGLVVTVEEAYDDEVASGKVISQSVIADKTVPKGTEITITVSKGTETVYYNCSYELKIPDGVVQADITLKGSEGKEITSWKKADVASGFTISKGGIKGISSGTIYVTWYKSVTADDGTTGIEEYKKDTFNVEFKPQS